MLLLILFGHSVQLQTADCDRSTKHRFSFRYYRITTPKWHFIVAVIRNRMPVNKPDGVRDSSVSIVTSPRAERLRNQIYIPCKVNSPQPVDRFWDPPQWVPGSLCSSIKRPGHEDYNLLTSSANFKKAWSCTSTLRISSWGGPQFTTVTNSTFTVISFRTRITLLS
jgi:hypothetical protein